MNQPDASAGEPRAGRNSRLSAEDWAQAALDLIAEQGVGAVAVEPLARRLRHQGQFLLAFPRATHCCRRHWNAGNCLSRNRYSAAWKTPDPRVRLRQLFQMVAHEVQPHIIYSELLKALDHPMVRPVIDRVSQRRLDYLVASFRQAGLSSTDARHRARLAYAAYVGFLQLSLQLQQQAGARGLRSVRRASDRDADSERMSAPGSA